MNTKIVHIKNNSKKEQVRDGLFFCRFMRKKVNIKKPG